MKWPGFIQIALLRFSFWLFKVQYIGKAKKILLSFQIGTTVCVCVRMYVCVCARACVCVRSLTVIFCFLSGSSGCEITQLYYLGYHMTISAESVPINEKKIQKPEFVGCLKRTRDVWKWAADLQIHYHQGKK